MKQRILKFRAWDNQEKKWYEPLYEAYKGNLHDLHISLAGRLAIRNMDGLTDESVFPDRYIITQFTGLRDQNGYEIYEGDIIKTSFGKPCVVEYKSASFMWAGLHLGYDEEEPLEATNTDRWAVVIGNIYENPTLCAAMAQEDK